MTLTLYAEAAALGTPRLSLVLTLGELLGVLYASHKYPYSHGYCRKINYMEQSSLPPN